MNNSDKNWEIIRNAVRESFQDADVRLFGSRARGDATPESDYDILVIINQKLTVKQKLLARTTIRKRLLRSGIRCDLLIQSKKDIEKKKKLPGHLLRSILKEAIVL
jgi:predicted nucleotidyltransferase